MPRQYKTPASLRYLKARLRTLTRPAIWGTAIFLSVVGLVIREYWLNPNFFRYLQNNPVAGLQNSNDSSLSQEDRAIAADIDNSPALLNEIEQSRLLATPGIINDKNKGSNNQGLFAQVTKKQQNNPATEIPAISALPRISPPSNERIFNPPPVSQLDNPFLVQAQNLLQTGTADRSSNSLNLKPLTGSSSGTATITAPTTASQPLNNQPNQNQNPVPASPLQAATNQYPAPNLPANNREIPPDISGLAQPLSANTLPSQPLTSTTSFIPPTGYSQPTVSNMQQSAYNFPNNQPLAITPVNPPVTSPVAPVAPVAPVVPVPLTPAAPVSLTPATPTNIPSSSVPTSSVPTPSQNTGAYYNFGTSQGQPSTMSPSNY